MKWQRFSLLLLLVHFEANTLVLLLKVIYGPWSKHSPVQAVPSELNIFIIDVEIFQLYLNIQDIYRGIWLVFEVALLYKNLCLR